MANEAERNLAAAMMANSYTRAVLIHGAGNRTIWGLKGVKACVWGARTIMNVKIHKEAKNKGDMIEIWASVSKRFGCGNCAEHAAIAFIYLRDAQIRPLDFMAYMKAWTDHAFVVLGREESSDLGDPGTWGKSAVVCDPYYDVAYSAFLLPVLMRSKGAEAPEVIWRVS